MNPMFSRILKALCTLATAALLSACGGATSTVDSFRPTRVIGLGDGYNNPNKTVFEALSTTGTVVEQIAAYFGQSNVVSQAAGGATIDDLANQISAIGSFTQGDLVVITVGTFDVKAVTNPATQAQTLVAQVQRLLNAGVKHVLIMPVLELSRTPWGRANSFSSTATDTFNLAVLNALANAYGAQTPNPVIYANASNLTTQFLIATSQTTYDIFTDTGYDGTALGTMPACGNKLFNGCVAGAAGVSTSFGTMLFADGVHLTPAGNRWVAKYLYDTTRVGSWI